MKQDDLLDALSEIDPEYIVEAEQTVVHKKHHKQIMKSVAIAACACLIVGGAYAVGQNILSSGTSSKSTGSAEVNGLDKGMDTSGSAIKESPAEDGMTFKGPVDSPEKIYYRGQCYERIESDMQYDMYLLTCLGELGEEDDLLHADTGLQDVKVYLVDKDQLLIELDQKQIIYEKVK